VVLVIKILTTNKNNEKAVLFTLRGHNLSNEVVNIPLRALKVLIILFIVTQASDQNYDIILKKQKCLPFNVGDMFFFI
jgi:hypothetical protein